MPVDPIVGTAVEAGLNIGGSLWSSQKDVDLYREMRDYNKPVYQVQRMKEAGLNPALMYGSGTVANTVGPAPKINSPRADGMDNLALQYAQINNLEEQRENIIAQRKVTEETARQMREDTRAKRYKNEVIEERGKLTGGFLETDPWSTKLIAQAGNAIDKFGQALAGKVVSDYDPKKGYQVLKNVKIEHGN